MAVKMTDVAAAAGVSVATVSNVFTGKHFVSPEIKDRVLQAVEDLDYHINLTARSLKTSKSKTIGIVLPDITKLFFTEVMRGILDTVEEHGYKAIYLSSYFDYATEKECIASLRSNNVDAIIIDTCCDYHNLKNWAYELATYEGKYTPIVFIESAVDGGLASSVAIDAYYWSGKLTRHLISLNKSRILFISGPSYLKQEHDVLIGYKQALKDNGIKINDNLIFTSDFSSKSSYKLMTNILKKSPKFDAIQASNDEAAIGAVKALKEHGLKIPDDIVICGFDNLFPTTLVDPAITTINVPRREIGAAAVNECIHHIEDPSLPHRNVVLSADMIVRGSTEKGAETTWDLYSW